MFRHPPQRLQAALNLAGGLVDAAFLLVPALLFPFARRRQRRTAAYARDLLFYIEQGYCDQPESFFATPARRPDYAVTYNGTYHNGLQATITWPSGYRPRNPNLHAHWQRFAGNQTACLVRWHHDRPGRPTVLCLHGFMLGDPRQAERMFRVRQLFELGLDVALFVTPFHWRRAPRGWRSRGMFLQPEDVCMTAEAIGQTMYDLHAAFQILAHLGAGRIGLIGASLGGYHAGLFSCLSSQPAFCAMMVPAVKFKSPLDSRLFRWLSGLPPQVLANARRVWDFTSPLGMTPQIDPEKILIVASEADRLCPSEDTHRLAARWPRAQSLFLTGGHWLIFNAGERGRAWYGLLARCGFIPEA